MKDQAIEVYSSACREHSCAIQFVEVLAARLQYSTARCWSTADASTAMGGMPLTMVELGLTSEADPAADTGIPMSRMRGERLAPSPSGGDDIVAGLCDAPCAPPVE